MKPFVIRRADLSDRPPVSPGSPLRHGQLLGIQAGRGIAALLVVFYHAGRMLSLPQYVGHIPLGNVFSFGHAGVDFFFVLSGFIITYVHHGDVGRPDRLSRFAWRRLTRIYPIYWVVTAVVVLLALLSHDETQNLRLDQIVPSLMLLPYEGGPLLGVAWTLEHEMLFYLAFALAILWRPVGVALVFASLMLVAAGQFGLLSGYLSEFLAAPYHLEFLMGILSALAVLRFRFPLPRILAAVGIVAFVAAGLGENANLFAAAGIVSVFLFGLSSAAIIIGAATAERLGTLRVGAIGALLGAASYSIYLTHTVTIGLTAHVMARLGIISPIPDWLMLLMAVCAAIAGGLAFHWIVERPLGVALRRLADSWRRHRAKRTPLPIGP